jgi:glycosyltransferase involved in cell wall biosynthesis
MRIGFVSATDARGPTATCGVPFHIRKELVKLGEVIDLTQQAPGKRSWTSGLRRLVPPRVREAARALMNGPVDPRRPDGRSRTRDEVLCEATRLSRIVAAEVAKHRLDVIFGYASSHLLHGIVTRVPIVYATVTTTQLMRETYWTLDPRPAGYMEGCDGLERVALAQASQAVFPTELARRSAIEHYGLDPGRAHRLPIGAYTLPPESLPAPAPIAPPSRTDLRLLFTVRDPVRQRLDLAVDAVERLRQLGWAAHLEVIGPDTAHANASPWVRSRGVLDPARPLDRAVHRRALERAHVLVLPSAAESFGVAPCEAANYGRPSVVSAAGGLPEVVLHGETGTVLPVDADANAYAQAILDLVAEPAAYRRACEASLRRAHTVLSWDVWRAGLRPILERALAEPPRRSLSA